MKLKITISKTTYKKIPLFTNKRNMSKYFCGQSYINIFHPCLYDDVIDKAIKLKFDTFKLVTSLKNLMLTCCDLVYHSSHLDNLQVQLVGLTSNYFLLFFS